jgi:hypothetical protein
MALGKRLGCLALWALIACGGKDETGEPAKAEPPAAVDLDKRCVQLAKICGDKAKHVEKMTEACKLAAKKHVEKGCTDKVVAAYDCYETELCAKTEKVWALDDLGVLAERHGKCVAARDALRACAGN